MNTTLLRVYYNGTNKLHHLAKVTAITGNVVQLDSTIFHPQGGGQPSDIGTIGGIRVLKVSDLPNGEIHHLLEQTPEFKIGNQVELEVDAAARKLFARLHSAGHLIAHVAEREFPGLKAIQGHHFPNEARVEFKYDVLPDLEIFKERLTHTLQDEIAKDSKVICTYEDGIRKIIFENFIATPCGGTHVQSLSEIQGISIRNIKSKDSKLRVGYDVV